MWEGIAFAVASVAGDEVRRKKLAGIDVTVNKSKFNRTGYPNDKQSRQVMQFKFFGYKPKRFISCYAKKPRIVIRVKKVIAYIDPAIRIEKDRQLAALFNQQRQSGIQYTNLGYQQMAAMNMAHGNQQAQMNGCLGNLAGLGQINSGMFGGMGGSWI